MTDRADPPGPALRPVSASERIEVIDVLRGLSILGMFVVNMSHDLPWGWRFIDNRLGAPVLPEVLVLETLGKGKFFALFAFLFGLGFAIQADRARARGISATLLHVRRMLALLVIGVAFAPSHPSLAPS